MKKYSYFIIIVAVLLMVYGVLNWIEKIEAKNTEVTLEFYNDSFNDFTKLNTGTENTFKLSQINTSKDNEIYVSIVIENTDNIPICFLGDIKLAEPELNDYNEDGDMFSKYTKNGYYYLYYYFFNLNEIKNFNNFTVQIHEEDYSYPFYFE